jgi:hypothetical protein
MPLLTQSGHSACASGCLLSRGSGHDFLTPLAANALAISSRAIAIWRRCCFPKVCPSRVRRLTVDIADFGVRPLAGHIEPSKATCRIRATINANLTVTPPIFGSSDSANRSASASAYLPPKYPGCRGVTQDFAQSVSGQHGQPNITFQTHGSHRQTNQRAEGMSLTNAWNTP